MDRDFKRIKCLYGKQGLIERFDSTIGSNTVLMPLGGKYQKTPAEGMAAKIPVLDGESKDASLMAYGFNPIPWNMESISIWHFTQ